MVALWQKAPMSQSRDTSIMARSWTECISWSAARIAFDAYQSRNGLQVEGISTGNAEYYGWSQMYSHSNGRYEAANMGASIKSFFSKMFYSILNIF